MANLLVHLTLGLAYSGPRTLNRQHRTAPPKCCSGSFADAWMESAWTSSAQMLVSSSLDEARAAATSQLRNLPFPSRKIEAWRRTDLSSLAAARLVPPSQNVADEEGLASAIAEGLDESSSKSRLLLVNGVCDAGRSDLSGLPDSVAVGSLLSMQPGCDAETMVQAALRAPLPEQSADARTALIAF